MLISSHSLQLHIFCVYIFGVVHIFCLVLFGIHKHSISSVREIVSFRGWNHTGRRNRLTSFENTGTQPKHIECQTERERDVQRNIILQRAKNPWVIKHAREMKWAFLRIFVLERIKAHEQTHIKSFSVSKIMNKTEYCMCLELLFCVCPQNN